MLQRLTSVRLEARCDRCLVPSGPLGTSELEATNRLAALGWTGHARPGGTILWVCPDCGDKPPLVASTRKTRRGRRS